MHYVVGSGPAGVSCAMALLEKGAHVTLLEPGLQLEPEIAARVANLRATVPEKWRPQQLSFMKEAITADIDGMPLKYAFGSDYAYRDPGVGWRIAYDGVDSRPSFSQGGLSTVWGAAVLPYRACEIYDWPITEEDLARHYRAVLRFVPLSAGSDALDALFPLYAEPRGQVNPSRQAAGFLQDMQRHAGELKTSGILFGRSRLAVKAQTNHDSSGCCYCGACMYGCPYGAIYNSEQTLQILRQNTNFTYRPGIAVDRVAEKGEKVILIGHDVHAREPIVLEGSHVFLAAGVLSTTRILLESLEAFDRPVLLKDCCYFLLPLLRWARTPGVQSEPLHTLSQVFLEILDRDISHPGIHLQIYSYNELYSVALRKRLGPLYGLLAPGLSRMVERLLLIQGYLPSNYSPEIRVVLSRDGDSRTLRLSAVPNERTRPALKKLVSKLMRHRGMLKAVPLAPMLRQGKPGRGFHSGGTFPMRAHPAAFESDSLGRPFGFERVHAVDATVFPSVPATTITLSVMANAHRIGSEVANSE